jgi:hypothetical protein
MCASGGNSIRRCQSYVLNAPKRRTVVLPGDYVRIQTPKDTSPDCLWALEPRIEAVKEMDWLKPQEILSVNHEIFLTNTTDEPVMLKNQEHLCQIRAVIDLPSNEVTDLPVIPVDRKLDGRNTVLNGNVFYSQSIIVDPDNILPADLRIKFDDLNRKYDHVFDPIISKYNGYSGNIEGNVNMGKALPPQRKARMPHYNREKLVQLQEKFDELEQVGFFAKPEDIGVPVEYLNMSFLVPKPQNKDDFRLVTAFGEVG